MYCCEDFSEQEKLRMNQKRINKRNEENNLIANELSIKTKYEHHTTTDLCFVYRTRLNEHSLVYGAEMDCFESIVKLDEPLDSNLFESVELKTCKHIENERHRNSFKRFKTMKWYNQSFLINVKKISVGYWRNQHIVDEIREYNLEELKQIGDWNHELCLNQLYQILSFIKSSFMQQNTSKLKFTYRSFSYKLICDDKDVKNVLPDFFKNEFNS